MDEWERWRDAWRREDREGPGLLDGAEVERLAGEADRARRSLAVVVAAELLLVIAAIGGLGAALWHAAHLVETILAVSAALTIVVVWAVHASARRRERSSAGASPAEYLSVLQRLRRRQLRFAGFVRVVIALELVFLVIWWIGGLSVHRAAPGAPITIAGFWTPLLVMLSLFAWTVRLRRTSRAELERLDALELQSRDD